MESQKLQEFCTLVTPRKVEPNIRGRRRMEFQSRRPGMRWSRSGKVLGVLNWNDKSKKSAQASMTSAHFYTRLSPLLKNIKISNRIIKQHDERDSEISISDQKKDECWGHKTHLIIWYVTSRQEHFVSIVSAACRCLRAGKDRWARKGDGGGLRIIQIIALEGDWYVFAIARKVMRSLDAT